MTDTTVAGTVAALARSMQFSHADLTAAVEVLRTPPDVLAPGFTPWTDEQITAGLHGVAELATLGAVSVAYAAEQVRFAASGPGSGA